MNNLNIASIKDGIEKIIENSTSLINEASILYEAGYYARTYTLSHIAREEVAKIFMLCRVGIEIMGGKEYDYKKIRKRFHSHKSKVELFSAIHIITNTDKLSKIKNDSLYVGYEGVLFTSPQDKISKEFAKNALELAKSRLLFIEKTKPISMLKNAEKMDRNTFKEVFSDTIFDKNAKITIDSIMAVLKMELSCETAALDALILEVLSNVKDLT